jgi:hypothetical protein
MPAVKFAISAYVADGTTTDYLITWDYLDEDHIAVYVDGTSNADPTANHTFTQLNNTTVRITDGLGNAVSSGAEIEIRRETPISNRAITFADGSALLAEDLNKNSDYLLFSMQEVLDTVESAAQDGALQAQAEAELNRDETIVLKNTTAGYLATVQSDATDADNHRIAAAASETAAEAAKVVAQNSIGQSSASAAAAAVSAQEALDSENNAASSETNAASSASAAAGSESGVAANAATASTKATEASTSAAQALGYKNTAVTKASESAASAVDSETSATNSETSAVNSETSAVNSEASKVQSGVSETNAATSETNAANSETNALSSANAAASSAVDATNNGAAQVQLANTARTGAETAETNALTSATNSENSKIAAGLSETNAADTFTDFEARYLGQKSAEPTTDNNNQSLVVGALFYDTTDNVVKVWEGSAWAAAFASLSGALIASNNLSDLTSASTARTNIGLTNNNALINGSGYITLNEVPANNGIVEGDTTVTVVDNGSDGRVEVLVNNTNAMKLTEDYMQVPVGTTAERDPNTPLGSMRYNTTTGFFESYTISGWGAIASPPVISSITPTAFSGDIGQSFTVNGAFFDSASYAKFIGINGQEYLTGSVTYVGPTQLIVTNASVLPVDNEPYNIRIVNGAGLQAESTTGIDAGTIPYFSSGSGNVLTTTRWDQNESVTIQAGDAESVVSDWSLVSGSLPVGYSLNSSNGVISGNSINGPTITYTFTIRVTDSATNVNNRTFNIQVRNAPPDWNSPAANSTLDYTDGINKSISLSATDPEGQPVSYSAVSSLPTGLSVSGSSIGGTPVGIQTANIVLRASDGYSTADRSFNVNVARNLRLRNGDRYTYRASSENFSHCGYTVKSVNLTRPNGTTYAGFVVEDFSASGLGSEPAWLLGHVTNAAKGGANSPWNPTNNMQGQSGGFRVGNYSGWNSIIGSTRVILIANGGWAAYQWSNTLTSAPKSIVDAIGASGGTQARDSDTNPNNFTGRWGGQRYAIGGTQQRVTDQYGVTNYVHLYGINASSDTDESVLAFTSQPADSNSWGDSWRGTNQQGTTWSLWNDDYGNRSWPSGGQGGPGRSGSYTTGTDDYMVLYC